MGEFAGVISNPDGGQGVVCNPVHGVHIARNAGEDTSLTSMNAMDSR